jgi:phytoene dehydrogenase-like protein
MIISPTITPPDADLKPLKEELIEDTISNLEKIVPNVRKAITEKDCFTSQDFEREIGLPKGCLGWSPTPDQVGRGIIPQKTFLKNLYLAGQWTSPGPGMNTCIISGMEAARLILKDERNYMAADAIEKYRELLL